jgi:tetratricopeptide (TPR) repeat protein
MTTRPKRSLMRSTFLCNRLGQLRSRILDVLVAATVVGCASAGFQPVSPAEMTSLEEQVRAHPDDGVATLRYAAGLFAVDACDSAVAMATRGLQLRPQDALGPLVIGQCREERAGQLQQRRDYSGAAAAYAEAVGGYDAYLRDYQDAPGSASVQARRLLASRSMATMQARAALAGEATLAQPSEQAVAVLPLAIVGDSAYAPLSRGLAQMMTSDLALLRRFRMVERLQVGAVLQELALGESGRVDRATAARVGRLVQAGRMVQGLAAISPEDDLRLEGTVVLSTTEVVGPRTVNGRFKQLLELEKELVVAVAGEMGYVLSDAELNLIRENGTQHLAAFLAYSRGLAAEDLGLFTEAAGYYQQAVFGDPSFAEARLRFKAARAAPQAAAASRGEIVNLATERNQEPDAFGADPARGALQGAIGDIASTYAEQRTRAPNQSPVEQVSLEPGGTPTARPGPEASISVLTAIIRIVFTIP